jgi:FkbM family methyltransferase
MLRGATHPEYSVACFETEEKDFREKYFHPEAGQVVVDVGASYGSYTLAAAAMGATVYAFEPEPTVFVDLLRNVEANGFGELVRARCSGLWSHAAVVDMASYAPHWPEQTISTPFNLVPLDRFNFPRLDWLKIDCEGAEEKVLEGAALTIQRCRPAVIVECHVFLDPDLTEKCKRLLPGYRLEEVPRGECAMLVGSPL